MPDTIGRFTLKYSKRSQEISPFYAMAFGEQAAKLESTGIHVVKLNLGEPDFGAPPGVLGAMASLANNQALPYTSALGLPELRAAIAEFYGNTQQIDLDPRRVVVTAGASAALLLLSAALVNSNDKVIMGDPCYPCNQHFITAFGGKIQSVPTSSNTGFQLNASLLSQYWNSDTKGLMLATPSNPTGTSVGAVELKAMCEYAREKGAWRIIDEIYLNLHHQDTEQPPTTALKFDNDAFIVNSFSKYFGMTGWRLGWCIVPTEAISVVEKLAQNYYICPSTVAQKAALQCFTKDSIAVCESRRKVFVERKNQVLAAFDGGELNDLGIPVMPDGAFYVYIDIKKTGLSAMTFCERALHEAHVALTPGNDFGRQQADQFIRLSFATSESELGQGLHRLKQFVKGLTHN